MRQCLAVVLSSVFVFGQQRRACVAASRARDHTRADVWYSRLCEAQVLQAIDDCERGGSEGAGQFVVDEKLRLGLKDFLGLTLDNTTTSRCSR